MAWASYPITGVMTGMGIVMGIVWALLALFAIAVVRAMIQVARQERDAVPPLDTSGWSDTQIAVAIADLLPRGLEFNRGWRDYGGDGLVYKEGKYIFAPSNDGHIDSPSEALLNPEYNEGRLEFDSAEAFVDWLVFELKQCGPCTRFHTNISRQRLQDGIAGCHGLTDEQIRNQGRF